MVMELQIEFLFQVIGHLIAKHELQDAHHVFAGTEYVNLLVYFYPG
jgi:hypothetical protein